MRESILCKDGKKLFEFLIFDHGDGVIEAGYNPYGEAWVHRILLLRLEHYRISHLLNATRSDYSLCVVIVGANCWAELSIFDAAWVSNWKEIRRSKHHVGEMS